MTNEPKVESTEFKDGVFVHFESEIVNWVSFLTNYQALCLKESLDVALRDNKFSTSLKEHESRVQSDYYAINEIIFEGNKDDPISK